MRCRLGGGVHPIGRRQQTGIPTGIGLTRTLAKLANHVAKSADRKPNSCPAELARVCNLATLPASDLDAVLQATAVGEVWGVGRRIAAQPNEGGVTTVLDLVRLDRPLYVGAGA